MPGAGINWERKPFKFVHRGMNWNRPVDLIPEGMYAFVKNLRNYRDGQVQLRPGLTLFTNGLGTPDYIHTITSLADYSPDTSFGPFTYVIGADGDLFVGSDDAQLSDPGLNPAYSGLSGNPLSTVAFQPEGGRSWMYIGDRNAMFSVGYHPTDNPGVQPARVYTMGLQPPVNVAIPAVGGAGKLNGKYQWRFAYRRKYTGARSNPSSPTRATFANPALTLTNEKATFTLPGPLVTDMYIDVYRFGGTLSSWRYVGSGVPGDPFTDNLADLDIASADTPPSTFNPDTGVQRFTLYQPFPTTDIGRNGAGVLAQDANGVWYFTRTGGDQFNQKWIPGTRILLNGQAFSIYQMRGATIAELSEDGGIVGGAGAYNWEVLAGATYVGQPLPHIWGPFGAGEGGAYIFGCGDPNRPHVLYWTNGNDPDSTDIANYLEVTSPAEPLRGGCVYDGKCFVWSTERMFAVYPSLTVAGQFYVQEVPGARGLYYEWSLTVQTGALQDKSITWVGKDGIYDWSNTNGLTSLTKDTLNPFFPRDNQPGSSLSEMFPSIVGDEVAVPDPAKNNKQRLFWNDGYLFYDFAAVDGHQYTLVYDSANTKGWVAVDTYAYDAPMSRGKLINFHQLLLSIGSSIYVYTGEDDAGENIPFRLVTGMTDMGDPRAGKNLGDLLFDVDTAGGNVNLDVNVDRGFGAGVELLQGFPYAHSGRIQPVVDIPPDTVVRTVGLDITGTATTFKPTFFGWEVSYVAKPEVTIGRPTDWTNLGQVGDKLWREVYLDADTLNVEREVNVEYRTAGGVTVASVIRLTHNGQHGASYGFEPFVAEFARLRPVDGDSWRLYDAQWTADPYPALTQGENVSAWTDGGYAGAKYLQGCVVPLDTDGKPVALTVELADSLESSIVIATRSIPLPAVTTPALFKTAQPYSWEPVFAHYMRVRNADPVRMWDEEVKWVWEPMPEMGKVWQTQPTTHDLPGFHFLYDAILAFISPDDSITLTISAETGDAVYTVPNPGGFARVHLMLNPQKGKRRSYRVESATGLRLFVKDCEVRGKAWGAGGGLQTFRPFGDVSRNWGARI